MKQADIKQNNLEKKITLSIFYVNLCNSSCKIYSVKGFGHNGLRCSSGVKIRVGLIIIIIRLKGCGMRLFCAGFCSSKIYIVKFTVSSGVFQVFLL